MGDGLVLVCAMVMKGRRTLGWIIVVFDTHVRDILGGDDHAVFSSCLVSRMWKE